ncbi:uncharacterized protein LOC100904173 [Galendromus occidentalis]|uniref:Uncharacterized protein LOC100904173 n=1 Tax=Galendromus occidentalis TaxID=34638 RepID=A0AAJ6QRS1_9ACAR|nr:uncharacterized protein LOC100904173 [Galendromus occidentalis]
MSAKKREEKCDLSECAKCSVLVLPKDREKHEADCGNLTAESDPDYEFIRDGILHATVREIRNRDPDLEKLSMPFQQQAIFLNPSTMKICGAKCGGYVHVSTATGLASLKVAWPNSALSFLAVCPLMPDRNIHSGTRIALRPYDSKVPECSSLELEVLDGEVNDDGVLIEAFRRKFFSSCLQRGSVIKLAHLCEIVQLKVRKALAENRSLEASLGNLSIDGESNLFFRESPIATRVVELPG